MEFKKINENTFQCLLTKEDMEDYDITVEDFLRDQNKTMEFMRKIIEMSADEIDFDPTEGGALSMQISPLPDDGLSLVFSNRMPMSGMDFLSHIRDILKSHLDGLEDDNLEDDEMYDDEEDETEIHYHTFGLEDLKKSRDFKDLDDLLKIVDEKLPEEKVKIKQKQRLYYFDSFSVLEQFCKTWSGKPVSSQILKVKSEPGYYLIIQKGRLSQTDYLLLVETLGEYATFISCDETKILKVKEYADTVIARDAVMTLNKL